MKLHFYRLQAFDYLLKTIINNSNSPHHHNRNRLKLVIRYNGELWSGDFIDLNGDSVMINFVDSHNKLRSNSYTKDTSLFLVDAFTEIEACIDALITTDDFYVIFQTLASKMINFSTCTDWEKDAQPIFPTCFFNARNLSNNFELPFISFSGPDDQIELVSIIKI